MNLRDCMRLRLRLNLTLLAKLGYKARIARSTKPRIDVYLYLEAQDISRYLHPSIRARINSQLA